MNFSEAVKSCFKKYYVFKGRSSRSEYWYWKLFALLVTIVLEILLYKLQSVSISIFCILVSLSLMIPGLAVYVRRLHDVGRSGWWMFTIFPPLYWIFIKGTTGSNKFGDDPLAVEKDKALT